MLLIIAAYAVDINVRRVEFRAAPCVTTHHRLSPMCCADEQRITVVTEQEVVNVELGIVVDRSLEM